MARDALRSNKRLALLAVVAALVAGVLALLTGATFARLGASSPGQSPKPSAGTVTLNTTASSPCTVTSIRPGQSAPPCTLTVKYGGSVPGYLALEVLIATKPSAPGVTDLYNPADLTNDLQITVVDNQSPAVTYLTPSTTLVDLGSCSSGSGFDLTYHCYQLANLLVKTTPLTGASPTVTFTTSMNLPQTNGSGYQGGIANVTLRAHAVQATNQTVGSCTAGVQCTSIGWN
jgi:hypothetical protein